jgi:hypothetical protein
MPNPHTNPAIKNTLLTLLVFLKHKAEEKGLDPVISVSKVIDLLRGSGLKLSYQQLVDLTQDPSIAPSIKSINNNQIEINLGDEDENTAPAMDIPMEPEEGEGEEGQEGGDEFGSDDFSFPEGEEAAPVDGQQQAPPEEEFQGRPQQSIITQMAKRAASRPD